MCSSRRRPFRRLPAVLPATIGARSNACRSRPTPATPSSGRVSRGADGLVVEFGRLNTSYVELLKNAMARGVTVVVANPYPTGRLQRNTYRHEGGESHLLSLGMIFTGTSGLKARVKLVALLSAGLSREEIRALFHAEWQ